MKLIMKLTIFFTLLAVFEVSGGAAIAQKITLNEKNSRLETVLKNIKKQSGFDIFFNSKAIGNANAVTLSVTEVTIEEALKRTFVGQPFEYIIEMNTIVVRDRVSSHTVVSKPPSQQSRTIVGKVSDEQGKPMAGVTVYSKSAKGITSTASDGSYSITIPIQVSDSLKYSYVGYISKSMEISKNNTINVRMEREVSDISDVVITGIYTRKKDSFTGSSVTFTGKELKEVGVQNVLQSLKTLDPAFTMIENNQYGSDPNRLPDLEIRGKSSIVGFKEQFGEDPNQPLFILDGFESTLRVIMDLSMDRIQSVTILKDAASSAIYGSKAANGVIVIETKAPKVGEVQITYSGSADISFADLNDYNLMNAEEKLRFELLSGRFESNLPLVQENNMMRYNRLSQDIKRGVNTDWLVEPLRLGINQRNDLYMSGGSSEMRYGLGISNRGVQGVMKNSKRDNLSGNLDVIYRRKKLNFLNKISVDQIHNSNPVVAFSEYSRANPYYRKVSDTGKIEKWLENYLDFPEFRTPNPLWDDALNSYNRGKTFSIRNNLNVDYRALSSLDFRIRLGISKSINDNEVFDSPDATRFDDEDILKKGRYSTSFTEGIGYEGNVSVVYGQVFNKIHQINAVLGSSINQNSTITKGFEAEGFPEGDFTTPAFSNAYPNSKPMYSDQLRRNVGFYLNTGYSLDNKYLIDVNLRSDGTSVFGSRKLFSTTWSAGVAWNIHNEAFFRNNKDLISVFKLRGSVGNPGNQNFGSFNSITTYRFNNWIQNNFGTGLIISGFGDPDLEWQKTLDKNIGMDLSMFKNRFHIVIDAYHKRTDPLLAAVGVPLSTGTSNRLMNIGMQDDKGISGTIKYAFIYKPEERKNWTMSMNFRTGKARYDKIGNKLDQYNRKNISTNMSRYYDGGSPTALWSVRSKGIDPATGKEIFIDTSGDNVFSYSFNNEVKVGETKPNIEGVFGNTFFYKGFSANLYIRYSYGGDVFNTTLYNKVENISREQLLKNQDRRALYDRWQKPGDIAQFRGISLTDYTPISSRFVQENNYLSLESFRVGYELNRSWLSKLSMSSLTLSAYMNDIVRVSTVKTERGIDYPFARTVTLGINANF